MFVWIRGITPRLGASELKQRENRRLDPENESIWGDPNISESGFQRQKKHCMNHCPGWDEDYFCSLVTERFRDEALEEADDLHLPVECEQELV